jgi:hypothetical protein
MDLLAVTFSSDFDFGCLFSELLGRVFFFSPSDSEVFDVKESFEAELRSFALYVPRFPCILSAGLILFFEFDRPTAVAVEPALFRPPNSGRTLCMGRRGE